ncbi:iron-siderophore ABC transporter substrate-binding protein [Phytoactinopolyspora endophytica]|uniref:iron-siderophore ABC transporter substrate-binding protein n=1 Tax=Phytoactinopolyspora endophytica TaxID=1642495 RepID=UPI0013ED9007|nr:iron-siderophore ABC transporter substrate-binding protein [Phytoactinopolyspora endophytica]
MAGLAVAGLLTVACGGDDGTTAGADSAGDNGDEAAANSDATTVVEHVLGEAEVPVAPERVVAIDPYATLPTAIAAGANVVGTSYQPFDDPFPPYVDASTDEIEDVGWLTELNVERIASLEPDVIVGLESMVEPHYDQLEQVAPTVALSLDSTMWKETLETVGAAIGRSDEVAASLETYEQTAGDLAEVLAESGASDEPVSLLNIRAVDDMRVYTESCATAVLNDLGVTMHLADETPDDSNRVDLSLERLTDADASTLLYFVGSTATDPEDAQATYSEVAESPLWEGLEVVQDGRAFEVNAEWWFNCGSVQAADEIMDDVTDYLVMQ